MLAFDIPLDFSTGGIVGSLIVLVVSVLRFATQQVHGAARRSDAAYEARVRLLEEELARVEYRYENELSHERLQHEETRMQLRRCWKEWKGIDFGSGDFTGDR